MALPFLAAVDISKQSSAGLSAEDLSRLGHVYVTATPENLDGTLSYIHANFHRFSLSVNATALLDLADTASLLDAGAARVFVSNTQLKGLHGTVDDSRLVLVLDAGLENKEKTVDIIADTSVGVYAPGILDIDFVTGWLKEYGSSNRPPVFVSFGIALTLENVVAVGKLAATTIIPCEFLTTDPEKNPDLLPVTDVLVAGITSDRVDKLIPTVVVDEQGVALGLVYSSCESIKESLRTGTGVYQSRKRGLWYKGATSGAVQGLVKIDVDCDQDCLRFVVQQQGAGEATALS
jgi:phosphoribosyl-AMP cyclohydrolase